MIFMKHILVFILVLGANVIARNSNTYVVNYKSITINGYVIDQDFLARRNYKIKLREVYRGDSTGLVMYHVKKLGMVLGTIDGKVVFCSIYFGKRTELYETEKFYRNVSENKVILDSLVIDRNTTFEKAKEYFGNRHELVPYANFSFKYNGLNIHIIGLSDEITVKWP